MDRHSGERVLADRFDHQDEAVEAIMRAYTPAPGSRRRHFRAQLHMAPGLGKTRVAGRIAGLVAAPGSMCMCLPTRALLEQTHGVLRAMGRGGPVIAAYASRGAGLVREPGVWVTTGAVQLVGLVGEFLEAGEEQYTLLTTYASIEETIIPAHGRRAAEGGGARLPEWDLLVTDESHHTETSKRWGRINSQHLVPARHRLAMTATPRLLGPVRRDQQGRLTNDPAVQLSEKLHGPVAYTMGLSEAQLRGKLARSRVVVAEVDEERLRAVVGARGRHDDGVQAELLASSMGAVLRAAGTFGCRRLLTFHGSVAKALAAAEALPRQSFMLHEQGTRAPQRVFAVALHQDTPTEQREAALKALADGTDLEGRPVDLVVVCSVKLLTEGIDVPAVDAVAICDPRGAQHELLQIAGRALRWDAANPAKTASIIVPVLHLERAADDTMDGPDWDPVINVLRAVESYEPDGGPVSTDSSSRRPGPAVSLEEERERREARARELAQMLEFTRQRSLEVVADRLRITVVSDPAGLDLEEVLQAVVAYQAQHGSLRRVEAGWTFGGVDLAEGLERLRRWRRADEEDVARLAGEGGDEGAARAVWRRRGPRVPADVVQLLAQQGFVWEPRASARQGLLDAARIYAAEHGHLVPRLMDKVMVDGVEIPIGRLLSECRKPGYGDDEDLDALGVWRVPAGLPWTAAWHRKLVLLTAFTERGGHRAELLTGNRMFRGDDIGKWLCEQHVRWNALYELQRQALTELHMQPAEGDGRVHGRVPAVRRSREDRLMEVVAAARQHLDEVGPLTDADGRHQVEDSYRPAIGGTEVKLRSRLNTVRARIDSYTPEQRAHFAALGLPWAQTASVGTPAET